MKVTRAQIVERGLANHCPNCGGRTLFAPGATFRINDRCSTCGLKFDRGDGFFLGPFVLNYLVTVIFFIVPVILLYLFGQLSALAAFILSGIGALGLPLVLYRRSWGWWLAVYFWFLPQKLPNNRECLGEDEEE